MVWSITNNSYGRSCSNDQFGRCKMTIIYNLLPVFFFFAMVYWAKARYSKSKQYNSLYLPVGSLLLVSFLYFQIQPSYMPKGEIKRSSIPAYESTGEQPKDLQPKPMNPEEREQKRQEK